MILSILLSASLCMTTLAVDLPANDSVVHTENQGTDTNMDHKVSSDPSDTKNEKQDVTQGMDGLQPSVTPEKQVNDSVSEPVTETEKSQEKPVAQETIDDTKAAVSVNVNEPFNASDFTYGSISETLVGCDYNRQIMISGLGVTGLSESGKAKMDVNKHLVIPSTDPNGTTIVGVGDGAFKNQGIEELTLPEGMSIPYDDTVTHSVTKRGNFVILGGAFYGNHLRYLNVPEGVISIGATAFGKNQLQSITFPHTLWMVGNSTFANNQLTEVHFPETVDFQFQIDGACFMFNKLTSVRLPNYCEKVYHTSFSYNPGMEQVPDNAPAAEKDRGGIVYMYTSNPDLFHKDRIHHIERTAESQISWHQKLILGDMSEIQPTWTVKDFTFTGTVITGLSPSGIDKRRINKDIILPDRNPEGEYVTEIAAANPGENGLFGTADEKLNHVILPLKLEKIGNFAFQNNNISEVDFPRALTTIGNAVFQTNQIKKVNLPNSVTTLGVGAFATNPTLTSVQLSQGLTEIPASAFANVGKAVAEKFTSISIPSSVTKIGKNAFTGASFKELVIPGTVKDIGNGAFAQTDKHHTLTTLTLQEGIENIENKAFAFANLTNVQLPSSVMKLHKGVFTSNQAGLVELNTINSKHLAFQVTGATYTIKLDLANAPYEASDFTYGDYTSGKIYYNQNKDSMVISGKAITGLSENGKLKFEKNKNLVLPAVMEDGTKIKAVANKAFEKLGVTEVTFPAGLDQFVIGSGSFRSNELTNLLLPEGICYVDSQAFMKNKLTTVTLPSTLIDCANSSFATNSIDTLHLPRESNPIGLQFSAMSFAKNKIKSVILPKNMDRVDKNTFAVNPGMEPSSKPNSGIVYLFATEEGVINNSLIPDGDYQKKFFGTLENYLWNQNDFTYEGTTITGLSESGLLKRIQLPNMIMPDTTPKGDSVTAIGNAKAEGGHGLFESEKVSLKSVQLPAELVSIGDYAFQANEFTSITLPDTVTAIGAYAFAQSSTKAVLASMTFPKNLQTIGDYAFQNSKIKKVELPFAVKVFPKHVFQKEYTPFEKTQILVQNAAQIGDKVNCPDSQYHEMIFDEVKEWAQHDFTYEGTVLTGLSASGELKRVKNRKLVLPNQNPQGEYITEIGAAKPGKGGTFGKSEEVFDCVTLPSKLQKIGAYAFQMNHLTEVTFPETLTEIGMIAFQMNQMKEVILPDSVISIGEAAFGSNATLERVKLSSGLTHIPKSAFGNAGKQAAEKFKEIIIPNGVVTIGDNAFAGAVFTEITLPKSVTSIGRNSFAQVAAFKTLKNIQFNEGLETIGKSAFKNAALTEVILPASLKNLDKTAFNGNKEGIVKAITNNHAHKAFQVDKATFEIIYEELLADGWSTRDFTYDGSTITGYSESGNKKRLVKTTLTLPNKNPNTDAYITNIGNKAFQIPDGEWEQGKVDVVSPHGKESVILPERLETIGKEAFRYNNLKTVNIPATTYSIGESAFNSNKISKLILPDTITEVQSGAFSVNAITDLRLSRGMTEISQGTFAMNINLTHIDIPDTIKVIGATAFAGARLESLEIPKSVEKIERKAFHLHHLTELRIPGNVKEIGDSAFEGTFKFMTLKNLVLEEGVEKIGALAFKEGYLKNVELPSTIKSIASDAFYHNAGSNNDHMVVLYTSNTDHMKFVKSDSHKMQFRAKWVGDCFTYGSKRAAKKSLNQLTYSSNTITGFSPKGREYLNYTKDVILPDRNPQGEKIIKIAKMAFANLGIETIILPKFLEVIEDGALSANALKEIELPNTLLEMAVNTFANNKDQVKLLVKDKDVLNRFKNQTLNGAVLVDKIVHEVPNNPPQVAGEQPFNQNVPTRDSFMDQKPTQAVNTGDDNPMAPLAGIAVGSLVLAIAVLLRRKKGSGQI